MLNKKLSKILVAGLSVLLLTGCSEIVAKPDNYDDAFVNVGDEMDGHRDTLINTIYDAFHDSSTLSTTTIKVLNEKLFNEYFGAYETDPNASELGIKNVFEAYIANPSDTTQISAFIDNHKAYQKLDADGNRDTSADAKVLEIERVVRTYKRIENLISEKIANALTGSDYKDINGLFSEKLFALSIYQKLHTLDPNGVLVKWADFVEAYDFYEPILLLPNLELYNEDTNTWEDQNIIHISDACNYYKEYIVKDILPDVYSHMLSEYYLYTKEYSSLGSKYARKATYISLTPNSKDIYSTKHSDLVNHFASNNILNNGGDNTKADLEILEKAWIGYDTTDINVKTLLTDAGFKAVTLNVNTTDFPALTSENVEDFIVKYDDILETQGGNTTITYFEGTLFGNIIENFREIDPQNIQNSSKAQENKFSGNNSYSYYDGFVKEVNSLLQKTFVVDDWGLKSDGFTGLDSSIKDRLMEINVATELKDYSDATDAETVNKGLSYLEFVKYDDVENGGYFYLLPGKTLPDNKTPFVFSSGTTKTIVQVEEAASVAKLSRKQSTTDSTYRYSNSKAEEVAFEICNLLADNSTTKSNALEFFLEDTEILFHDDKILEYFKENYPNLFED